jgi:AraC-like DNA-binding protein
MSENQVDMARTRQDRTRSPSAKAGGEDALEQQVVAAITRLLPTDPSLVAVAAALGISVRTLQRRLSARGLSYRCLLDDVRRQRAEVGLRHGEERIADISRRLGYSDPAHFVRAFRRWTGQPPSHYEHQRHPRRRR